MRQLAISDRAQDQAGPRPYHRRPSATGPMVCATVRESLARLSAADLRWCIEHGYVTEVRA